MLAHKANGDCIYLEEKGCSIHGRAPYMCRTMDCRTIPLRFNKPSAEQGGLLAIYLRGLELLAEEN
jgi:Fe-S-cluster containining protein